MEPHGFLQEAKLSDLIKVNRWIDLDSDECKALEYYTYIRKVVFTGLEYKIIKPDNSGCLWMVDGNPVHAKSGEELVGIKYSKKAAN